MALIDDPKAWILRLFELEEHEGRGAECARFPDGVQPPELPLVEGEKVYGIYKDKYYFTLISLIVVESRGIKRIPWADVRSCSSEHGQGQEFSKLTLADGRKVRVRIWDMAFGWQGRISQLYHQMIERHSKRAAMGTPPMPMQEFFAIATDDYSIAPNLEPHPSLDSFHTALLDLERADDGTRILMDLIQGEEELVTDAIFIVSPRPKEQFEGFAKFFGADGVIPADERSIRRVGDIPDGFNVWHVVWD